MQLFQDRGQGWHLCRVRHTTGRANIIVKSDIVQQRLDLIARIGAPDPEQPTTNAAWIAWGKAHLSLHESRRRDRELARVLTQ